MKKIKLFLMLILFCSWQFVLAQTAVTGSVTDSKDGSTLPGVSVVVKGTTNGTVTDASGTYSIKVSPEQTLQFSFIGYTPQDVAVGNQSIINVSLETQAALLEEVVVTAMGMSREKRALGYAITEVKGKQLSETGQTNVISALSGKVAGLQITAASSGIDGTNRILIRGVSSLSNDNQPLIVVDGIPLQANQQLSANTIPDYTGVHDFGSPIGDVNPEDIENLSVLKGASATALYGSRAANGVILITTKTGTKGQKGLGVSFSTSYTFENPLINELPWQKEYGQGKNGQYSYVDGSGNTGINEKNLRSWGPKFEGQMISQWDAATGGAISKPWVYHNNWKNFFETGSMSNSTLGLSFGGENSSSRVSDKLKVQFRGSYSNMDSPNRVSYGYGTIRTLYNMPANIDILDLKEYYKTAQGDRNSFYDGGPNPYFDLYENQTPSTRNKFSIGLTARYELPANMYIEGTLSDDMTRGTWKSETAKWKYDVGAFSQGSSIDQEINANFNLGFAKKISDFDISAFVGAERRNIQNSSESASTSGGLINKGVFNIDNSLGKPTSNHYFGEKEVHSVLGMASIGYKSFLYLDLSGRNDWSSTLPEANRSYFYPSVSGSFVFTEAFKIKNDILNFGKLRASWARVGS